MTAKEVSARCRRYVVALGLLAILAVAASEASAAPVSYTHLVLQIRRGVALQREHFVPTENVITLPVRQQVGV